MGIGSGLAGSLLVGLAIARMIGSVTTDVLRFLEHEQWTTATVSRDIGDATLQPEEPVLRAKR